jgi:hypothetical protein
LREFVVGCELGDEVFEEEGVCKSSVSSVMFSFRRFKFLLCGELDEDGADDELEDEDDEEAEEEEEWVVVVGEKRGGEGESTGVGVEGGADSVRSMTWCNENGKSLVLTVVTKILRWTEPAVAEVRRS